MKDNDKKNKNKNENKYGVFNQNVINSETINTENDFDITPYQDDSLTIVEIKGSSKKNLKNNEIINKKPKKKISHLFYKIIISLIIALTIIGGIIFLVVRN